MKQYILYIILALIISSCGPAWHLKRSQHHIDKAISKGAQIKRDTIQFHFKSPEIKFSTTIKPTWQKLSLSKDTLRYTDPKTGSSVKAKIDLKDTCPEDCIETVYLEAECPPQDIVAEVPCETVKAGHSNWDMIILAIFCLGVGVILGRLFWK